MTEILDISYDNDTGEITQFLIIGNDGQPDTKRATPDNLLLYDPEDKLPFDGGLNTFLSAETGLRVSTGPKVVVGQAGDEYSYVLSVDGSAVETTPRQSEDVLQGVYEALSNDDAEKLVSLHSEILSTQVRRELVNILAQTFEQRHRISIGPNGWLIDGFYLVDWNAKMYTKDDDPDEGDYVRSNGDAVKKDKSYEFVRLNHSISDSDCMTVMVNGDEYTLSEREMLFLSKVKWLLHRRHYHPDQPFWNFADRWANVDDDEPDIDVFDI